MDLKIQDFNNLFKKEPISQYKNIMTAGNSNNNQIIESIIPKPIKLTDKEIKEKYGDVLSIDSNISKVSNQSMNGGFNSNYLIESIITKPIKLTDKQIKEKYGDILSIDSNMSRVSNKSMKGGNYSNSNIHKMNGGNYSNSNIHKMNGGNYSNSNSQNNLRGGNYPGYCDGDANITQCSDMTTQCGAGLDTGKKNIKRNMQGGNNTNSNIHKMNGGNYSNSNSQNNLRGGNYPGYCDGDANISQCTDVTTQCGAGKKSIKKRVSPKNKFYKRKSPGANVRKLKKL